MIKKKRKKKKSIGRGHLLSPKELFIQNVQQAHQQTGLKNFPEAVRLYSIAIEYLQRNEHLLSPSPYKFDSEDESHFSPRNSHTTERKLETPEEIDNTHTPLYVLYGCRSQAYQGMQQFALALKDAESSIRCNPHHALAYAQKGKVIYKIVKYIYIYLRFYKLTGTVFFKTT